VLPASKERAYPAPNNPLGRAFEILREEGLRGLWFRVLGETVYRRMVLFERLLDEPFPSPSTSVAVEISLLNLSEVEEYVAFHDGMDAAEVHHRLEHGGKCFVVRHKGSIVNACWTAEGSVWVDYLGCTIELARDEAYVYNNYTAPRFRNLGIPLVRAVEMLRHFRALGYRRLYAVVVPENKAAFRPAQKAGYRPIGVIGYVRIGPWRHYMLSAWHRRHNLE